MYITYEEAYFYKLLLENGFVEEVDQWIDNIAVNNDTLDGIKLDLVSALGDANKIISSLHNYLLDKNKVYSFFKDTFMSKIIYSISVCSYVMFLVHYFFVYSFRYIEKNLFPVYSANPAIYFPLILFIVIFCSWLTVYILSKIPYLKEISGAH